VVLGALLSDHRAMSASGEEPDTVLPPSAPDEVVPPADPSPTAPPVVRRRSTRADARPSLQPPLLSGRSLEAPRSSSRLDVVRDNKAVAVVVLLVLVAMVVVLGGKLLADRAADAAMQDRAAELGELLEDATPEDFLAFGASVRTDGSLAQRVRDTDGFVNVKARAELAFIRFQPSGWWSGFTERCLVAYVRADGTTIETPKTPCNRVRVPGS
jgi:hypothetical protein